MKIATMIAAGMLTAGVKADNLFPDGDFSRAKEGLAPHVLTNGGRVRLHTENLTWNRCGRLFDPLVRTNAAGVVTVMAGAMIGSDGKTAGIPVSGKRTYDFSLEVRGNTRNVGIGAWTWGKGVWKDGKRVKTTVDFHPVKEKDWTTVRGSFTVPDGKTRAAVYVQFWGQTASGKPQPFAAAPEVFFDNVKVEEASCGFAAPASGVKSVPPVKAVAPGVVFSDFLSFAQATGCTGPSPVGLSACFGTEKHALVLDVEVKRAGGNRSGRKTSPWSGDCLELHFAAPETDAAREYTQFAWNAAGAVFARTGVGATVAGFEIVDSRVADGVWTCRVRIPLAAIGLKTLPPAEAPLAFNLGFVGAGVGISTWSPVVTGFSNCDRYGHLYCRGYAAALKARWGTDEPVADRAAFERRFAELATAARREAVERFRDAAFTVTVVPGESDWTMPFVPRASFDPVREIRVRAAVNERLGIPVAVLNATDAEETYVVRLETSTFDAKRPYADLQSNGRWGLEGFPPDQITAREAIPVKDTDSTPVTTRLDPLPKMNEACTIRVPPQQAGLVWFDIDTKGVAAKTYRGRVRVIPLSQPSKFESCGGYGRGMYKGKMQDVPVSLEVLPITLPDFPRLPSGFFQTAVSEGQFDLMVALGTREFQVSPWSFGWKLGADRQYDYSRPSSGVAAEGEKVKRVVAWAKARGFRPTFFVGFNCFPSFGAGSGKKPAEALRLWPGWLRGVKRCMNEWGVSDAEYNIEVYDEPAPSRFEEVKNVLASAKKAEPTVRLSLTMCARMPPVAKMRELSAFVDSWILWSTGHFSTPERLRFIRDERAAGREVWHYTCSESARHCPYRWYRLHPWYGLRHDLTGNQFFWFQNGWGGYGATDFKNRASSGIVYSSFTSTIPSLRYMAMRAGVTDLRYLDALRAAAGDRPEVKAFLRTAATRVVETERHDRTAADRVRAEAVRLLLEAGKKR